MQAILDIPDDLLRQVQQVAEGAGQSASTFVVDAIRAKLATTETVVEQASEPAWLPLFGGLAHLGKAEHEHIRQEIAAQFERIEPEIWK